MRKKHVLLTIFLSLTLFTGDVHPAAAARPIVRLIYFLPSDRVPQPEIDEKLDALIKEVQRFYANQMEVHGFGRKTFAFETDTHGNAIVHHVVGQFTDEYYSNLSRTLDIWKEIGKRFDASKHIYLTIIDTSSQALELGACGLATDGMGFLPASGQCFTSYIATHELAHAFGLHHGYYLPDAKRDLSYTEDPMLNAFCSAEWLDAHRAFNPHPSAFNKGPSVIQMLPPSLASPPNIVRLRFLVADPDGIQQAQFFAPGDQRGSPLKWIGCKSLNGTSSSIFEFDTPYVTPKHEFVYLQVMDVHGNATEMHSFPINITPLLPAEVVSIPDANLAAAIRDHIGHLITTRTMLSLTRLHADNRQITNLTGLEHAHNLEYLNLSNEASKQLPEFISNFSPIAGLTQLHTLMLNNAIFDVSDISVLAGLPQLLWLELQNNSITDITDLSSFTQVEYLWLQYNAISDVSALSSLTQLRDLHLNNNAISDISRLTGLKHLNWLTLSNNDLNDAALGTHIPAMQAKGVEVRFDNIAASVRVNVRSPAKLLKVSGDVQHGTPSRPLATPLVVEVQAADSHPLAGIRVKFSVTAGGGNLSTTRGITDANGRAQTSLTLGSQRAVNKVQASVAGINTPVTFSTSSEAIVLVSANQRPPMYWIDADTGTLHRLVGAKVENLVPSVQNATSLAVDMAGGSLYWTERTGKRSGNIRRANLDGTNVEVVKALTSLPSHLSLDATGGKLYLTNAWGKIQRLNVDGSRFESNLITGLKNLKDMAVDVAGGKIYWITQTGERRGDLRGANLDGTKAQLVQKLTSVPYSLAVDTKNSKLYLTNAWGKIQRLNVDGSRFESNLITGLDTPKGIALDTVGRKIYWTEQGTLRCAAFNGENLQNVVTGFGTSISIVVGSVPDVAPVAAAPTPISVVPNKTALLANYPNPFNPETYIPYQLEAAADVTLRIYAVDGQIVRTLALGHRGAGIYMERERAAYWDGRNAVGESMASGVYFYTLTAGDFMATRKLLIRK